MVILTKEYIISEINLRKVEIKKRFNVKKLYLFGSYARDEQKEGSDIDILVEFTKDFKEDFSNELDFQTYLYTIFKIDVGVIEKDEVRKEYIPYIINENLIEVC